MTREPNARERDFMVRLATGYELRPADREEDRSRQWCRSHGYVSFDRVLWQWGLTRKGQDYLTGRAAK